MMTSNNKQEAPSPSEKPFPDRKWYAAVLLTLGVLVILFYYFTKHFK